MIILSSKQNNNLKLRFKRLQLLSSYEPFKGISISVLENPHNDNIQYEIEDQFGNIIRSGNISSYLRQDDQTGKHYLVMI